MSIIAADRPACPAYSDVVWDKEHRATVSTGWLTLPAGDSAGWAAEVLLATAVGSSVMTTFTDLAREADLRVLGYVAHQTADLVDGVFRVHVNPCITVASAAAAERAHALWMEALALSPIIRALRHAPSSEPHFIVLPEAEPVDAEC